MSCDKSSHLFCFPVNIFCFWLLIFYKKKSLTSVVRHLPFSVLPQNSSVSSVPLFSNYVTLEIHQQCCILISKCFLYSYLSFCFLIFVYSVFVRSSMTVTICAYLDCCLSCLAPPVTRLKYTMKLAGTTLLHECKYVLLELG